MERHRMAEHTRYERLYGLFLAYAALLALFGLIMDTPVNILRGLSTIILTEDALITDYVLIAGPGAALVNSALVTAISTLILRRSGEPFNGFSPVVVGLMSGFSLFGKNFVNIWPILLGTFLYAKKPPGARGQVRPSGPAGHRPGPGGQLHRPGQRLGDPSGRRPGGHPHRFYHASPVRLYL